MGRQYQLQTMGRQFSKVIGADTDHTFIGLLYIENTECRTTVETFLQDSHGQQGCNCLITDAEGLFELFSLQPASLEKGKYFQASSNLAFVDAAFVCGLETEADPVRIVKHLRAELDKTWRGKTPIMRVVVDVNAFLRCGLSEDAALQMSRVLEKEVFSEIFFAALCIYDRRRFSLAGQKKVLQLYPWMVVDGKVVANPLSLHGEEPADEVAWLLQRIGNLYADKPECQSLKSESSSAEETAYYESIMGSIQDIVFTLDRRQRHTGVFGAWVEKMGLTREHFIGKTVAEILGEKAAQVHQEAFSRAMEGHFTVYEWSAWQEDREIFVQTSLSPIVDQQGTVQGLVGIGRDITRQKEAESALKNSYRLLDYIIEHNRSAVAVHDRDLNYLYVSRRYLEEYHVQEKDIIGRHHYDVFPDLPQKWRDVHQRALSGEVISEEDDLYIREDGSEYWTRWECRPWYESPGVIGGIIIYTEVINRQRETEALIRRRNRELETLLSLASVLHQDKDLATLLPALLGKILSALRAEDGAIWHYNRRKKQLELAAAQGWQRRIGSIGLDPERSLVGKVYLNGEPYVSENLFLDPGQNQQVKSIMPKDTSGFFMPIRNGKNIIGVAAVTFGLPRIISDGERRLLRSVLDMAGTAIARLDLFEETVRRLKQLQALAAIDRAINIDTRLDTALDVLLEQVMLNLKADAGAVYLLDSGAGHLGWVRGRGFPEKSPLVEQHWQVDETGIARASREQKTIIVREEDTEDLFVAAGYSCYAAVPLVAKGVVKGVMVTFYRQPPEESEEWSMFMEALGSQAAIAVENRELFRNLEESNRNLREAYDQTIRGWSQALDLRDQETEGHSQRVADLTLVMAQRFGVPDDDRVHIRRGALLHDIGKMGIPDHILLKPGPLSSEEWTIMKSHPGLAYTLLSPIRFLHPALDIPYCHHERWDGSGYPRGLKEEEIPLAARIFAVADVFDALTSERPYRSAWSREDALIYIHKERGRHFDPAVVDLFFTVISDEEGMD